MGVMFSHAGNGLIFIFFRGEPTGPPESLSLQGYQNTPEDGE
jgi:hypothetical protein